MLFEIQNIFKKDVERDRESSLGNLLFYFPDTSCLFCFTLMKVIQKIKFTLILSTYLFFYFSTYFILYIKKKSRTLTHDYEYKP